MIKNVIFDVDGTLVDSVDFHAQAWQRTLEKFGKTVDIQDVRDQIGKGGDKIVEFYFSAEEAAESGEKIEEYRAELFKNEYLQRVQPLADARTLIARIAADGKKIALASSAKEDEFEHFKELLGVEDFLDAETNADDAENSKPDPDIFLAALKQLGNPNLAETIVIGDAPYDAIAARAAGLQTIGVLSGGFDEAWLKEEGCVEIYKNPADLLANYETSMLSGKDSAKPKTLTEAIGSLMMLL